MNYFYYVILEIIDENKKLKLKSNYLIKVKKLIKVVFSIDGKIKT